MTSTVCIPFRPPFRPPILLPICVSNLIVPHDPPAGLQHRKTGIISDPSQNRICILPLRPSAPPFPPSVLQLLSTPPFLPQFLSSPSFVPQCTSHKIIQAFYCFLIIAMLMDAKLLTIFIALRKVVRLRQLLKVRYRNRQPTSNPRSTVEFGDEEFAGDYSTPYNKL